MALLGAPASTALRCGLIALLVYASATAWVSVAAAQNEEVILDHSVKAAYLYKFTGYIGWPDSAFPTPATPIAIGVIGADELATELDRMVEGRRVQDRLIVVKRLRRGDPLDGLHVLFVSNAELARIRGRSKALEEHSVLTVTESDDADSVEALSVINFRLEGDRVRFDVSLDTAQRNELRIGSQLLAVARKVTGEAR